MGSYQPLIKRVAIIGAGPTGLAFAKYLLAEKAFDKIDVFEQRVRVGGVWNLSRSDQSRKIPIPQTNPRYGTYELGDATTTKQNRSVTGNDTLRTNKTSRYDKGTRLTSEGVSLEYESPLYDYLETNIPKQIMAYSDKPFASHLPLYPRHEDVLQYLEEYADDVRHLITFRTRVQDVRIHHHTSPTDESWLLTIEDLESHQVRQAVYDAVVVANGHYTLPKTPDVPGMAVFHAAYPEVITHSKSYRRPEDFRDKKVLVVGNSASGLDIAAQISQYTSHPVYLSSRSASQLSGGDTPYWRKDVDELVEFLSPASTSFPTSPAEHGHEREHSHERAVRTKSGGIISHLDAIIYATGYFYTFPFLSSLDPPLLSEPSSSSSSGLRTNDVYHHFLHIEHHTLAVPVLNLKIIPFPLAENQAAVVARLWSGRLRVPSRDEMRKWEAEEEERKGNGEKFHLKRFPEDAAQLNDLYRWAESASSTNPGSHTGSGSEPESESVLVPGSGPSLELGLENDGKGKLGTRWGRKDVWLRSQFPAIKAKYTARGERRKEIKRPEELGFVFEEHERGPDGVDEQMFQEAHVL